MVKIALKVISAGFGGLFILAGTAHAGILDAYATNNVAAGSIEPGYGSPVVSYTSNDLASSLAVSLPGTSATSVVDSNANSITVSSTSSLVTENDSNAFGEIRYYYGVVGATGPVPVDISYRLYVDSTTYGASSTATAEFSAVQYDQYYSQVLGQDDDYIESSGQGSKSSDKIYSTIVLFADEINEVLIEAGASTQRGPSTAYAYIDPYIYIDPVYLAANPGVSLEVSTGIGNSASITSAAPEPETWSLMLIAMGCVGGALRMAPRKKAGLAAT